MASCDTSPSNGGTMKIVTRMPSCVEARRGVEVGAAVDLHLREQQALASPHRRWISPRGRLVEIERLDGRQLTSGRNVARLEGRRVCGYGAISRKVRHHGAHVLTPRDPRNPYSSCHNGGTPQGRLVQHLHAMSAYSNGRCAISACDTQRLRCSLHCCDVSDSRV